MSNTQAGTRLTSSSDWTRMKKLTALGKGNWNNAANASTELPIPQTTRNVSLLIPRTTGTSKYRNMASDWTNFKAYNAADYVLQSQQTKTTGKNLSLIRICSCTITPLQTKVGLCVGCNGTSNKGGNARETHTTY
jgi:hypothetical protein